MSNKQTKDPKGENTTGGDHLGGTHFGQAPDAKTREGQTPDKGRQNADKK